MTEVQFFSDLEVNLIDSMGSDFSIAKAAWVSTKAEEAEQADSERIEGLINFLMKNRHGTPFEHNAVTLFVKAPIVVFREWHRHRVQSYNEESGRYRQLRPHFYIPSPERPLIQVGKPGHYEFIPGTPEQYKRLVVRHHQQAKLQYQAYEEELADGIAKEVARMVLGTHIYTSMYATFNIRALMSFLSLRTKVEESMFPSFPMWEIEQCALKVEQVFAEKFPTTYTAFVNSGRVAP